MDNLDAAPGGGAGGLIAAVAARLADFGELVKFSHTIFLFPFALSAVILAHGVKPVTLGAFFWVVVALVNHPNAGAARPVLQALLDWVVLAEGTPASAVRAERPERLTRAKPP